MTYEECKEKGLCPQCRKRKAIDGYFYCEECLEYKRKSTEAYRNKKHLIKKPRKKTENAYIPCRLAPHCLYGGGNGTCDYYIKLGVGHRRSEICGVDMECTVFEPLSERAGEAVYKLISKFRDGDSKPVVIGKQSIMQQHHEEAMGLYKKGLYDTEIARAIGVSTNRVFEWRKSHGLPANTRSRESERT